jgi:hypothetical protein
MGPLRHNIAASRVITAGLTRMRYSFDNSRPWPGRLCIEGDLFVCANILRRTALVNTLDKPQVSVIRQAS